MKRRVNIILYVLGFLAFVLMVTGCGEAGRTIEDKLLEPFAKGEAPAELDTALDSEDATHVLSGSMEVLNVDEMKIIASNDFSGKVLKGPRITMNLKIEKSGLMSKGNISMRVYDREASEKNPYFVYRAECSMEGRHCGSFLNKKLDVMLYDGVGYLRLTSAHAMNGENELSGFVTVDGHTTRLGEFSLTMENLEEKSQDQPPQDEPNDNDHFMNSN